MIRTTARASLALSLALAAACGTTQPAAKADAKTDAQTGAAGSSKLGEAALAWSKMEQPKEFVDFFEGTFDNLGLTVAETGEQFTVHLKDGRFTFESGIVEPVDGVVPLKQENVERMVTRVSDGKLDADDAYAIMAVLFTPMTREALKHRVASDENLKAAGGIDDHMYVVLLDPQGNEGASHTLLWKNKAWEVTEGKVGEPQRTFKLTAMQAREYQQQIMKAKKRNDPVAWLEFGAWYKGWRDSVSTVATAATPATPASGW